MRLALFAPEVVQTSAMDCGPASLKCLLEGVGRRVSYGRLREACQTDVDGTSIDTLEDIANDLGLRARQAVVPADHVGLAEGTPLPALVVTRLPNGLTHFVVAWRRFGRWIQLMDPDAGRRWMRLDQFQRDLHVHTMPIEAAQWHAWALDGLRPPVSRQLRDLGVSDTEVSQLVTRASRGDWRTLAALDAATRMVSALVSAKALRRGAEAGALVGSLLEFPDSIPSKFWMVGAIERQASELDIDDEPRVLLRGAVVLSVKGLHDVAVDRTELSPELAAALDEPAPRPLWDLLGMLRRDRSLSLWMLLAALLLATGGVLVEVVVFRALLELARYLGPTEHRVGATATITLFGAALLLLELFIEGGVRGLGRRLEIRLRVAFVTKLPRLKDQYFRSRLIADMAERCHAIHRVRELPPLGAGMVRATAGLIVTAVALSLLDPGSTPLAIVGAVVALGLPLAASRSLVERELRLRSHNGSMARLYLDAMLGMLAIQTHSAQRAVRREHEAFSTRWMRAGLELARAGVMVEGLQRLAGYGIAAAMVVWHLQRTGSASGSVLLLTWWALQLPACGRQLGVAIKTYPSYRNVALRLMEPLGAIEDERGAEATAPREPRAPVALDFRGVGVVSAGHSVLRDIDLSIAAGEHVAIVGRSGAGKSSLAGVLLGWCRTAGGELEVDRQPWTPETSMQLRQHTVWIDPEVHLWNESLLDNMLYGHRDEGTAPLTEVLDDADLRSVLEVLPEGLQSDLGEGGGRLSGGQGQRVRIGRGMLKRDPALVILDEPFRGLDRDKRRELQANARARWRDTTLLFISHDISDTQGFDRVIVLDEGRIVEDGAPGELAATDTVYRTLLEGEVRVRERLWKSASWRRMWLQGGCIEERS